MHFVEIIQLTQFCVSTIHTQSSAKICIKKVHGVVTACTVHHKYLDASSKVSHLHFQFPIGFQSHGSCVGGKRDQLLCSCQATTINHLKSAGAGLHRINPRIPSILHLPFYYSFAYCFISSYFFNRFSFFLCVLNFSFGTFLFFSCFHDY